MTGLSRRSPLARTTGLRRTGRLRARSAKTERLYRTQRRPLVATLLAERPVCEVQWDGNCQGRAVDVDEILSRAQGGSVADPANLQTACRWCHTQKHLNPAEAVRRGLTRRRAA